MDRFPPLLELAGAPSWHAASGLALAGITADSRRVRPGVLFAALSGSHTDGQRFIADAVERGACAVLAAPGTVWPPGVPPRPLIEDPQPRRRLAQLASAFAGRQPATTVAVTGTNGKTSTVEFLRQIWQRTGSPAAGIGTLGLVAPALPPGAVDASLAGLTTPDPVALATLLAQLAAAGVEHAALEASSHGLDQFRLDGVRLAAAGFTNLTRDHLDYHATEDAYRQAKLRLFAELLPAGSPAVAAADMDPQTLAALQAICAARHSPLHTTGPQGTLIRLIDAVPAPGGQHLRLRIAGRRKKIFLPLPGRFQADNALLAAGLALALGARDPLAALPHLAGVRGRMELAATLANGATVYVDYAHTPDALRRLLAALRPHATGRLHVVFGAGGDRDPGKRPLMGQAAAHGADVLTVTDDNPRSEDPALIRRAVLAGCPDANEIGDRAAAIAAAMDALRPGDVLAVAGKGHEQGQQIGGTTLPFDDVTVVRSLLAGPVP